MHRDLKPHNVFLAQGGIVKLGDFGIAKTLEHTCDMAKSAVGTPLYCSPEICMGKMYNTKSDSVYPCVQCATWRGHVLLCA